MIYYATREAAAAVVWAKYKADLAMLSFEYLTEETRFRAFYAVITLPRGYAIHRTLPDGRVGSHVETIRWWEQEAKHAAA